VGDVIAITDTDIYICALKTVIHV